MGWGVSLKPWNIISGIPTPTRPEDPVYGDGPRNSLGVRYDADKYGMDTMTALSRDQWDTYLKTFMPMENNMIKYASDLSMPTQNAERAIENVGTAFDQMPGMQQRRMKAYGIQASEQDLAALDRSTKLNRSLTEVQAGNMARDATIGRQRAILGTGGNGGLV